MQTPRKKSTPLRTNKVKRESGTILYRPPSWLLTLGALSGLALLLVSALAIRRSTAPAAIAPGVQPATAIEQPIEFWAPYAVPGDEVLRAFID